MTHPIRYWPPLERAFDRMRTILFEPFDLAKWMVLGFSAFIAGHINAPTLNARFDAGRSIRPAFGGLFYTSFLEILGVFSVIVIVLYFWVTSRGKFIFLDNVIHDRADIVRPWHQFRRLGDSLFLWRAAFTGIVIAVVAAGALLPAIPVGLLSGGSFDDLSIGAMTLWGVFSGLVVTVVVVIYLYVRLFLNNFVVPMMYRFDLKATEAWNNFMPWFKAYSGQFILYGFFVLLIWIGFAIVSALVCLVTCCVAGLPYIGTVILLPIWVTYRAFSLEWLAQFDPGFDFFVPLAAEPAAATETESEVVE